MASHRFALRVYWEDTDAGGIVYYANYLKFIERARTEALAAAGISQSALRERLGVVFVVREARLRYRAPARLDDQLVVTTRLVHASGARIVMEQTVWRDTTELVACEVELACLDAALRPVRVPAEVRTALAGAADPEVPGR